MDESTNPGLESPTSTETDLRIPLTANKPLIPKIEYEIYIGTTPEKLWEALTNPQYTKLWWRGREVETDWQVGSPLIIRYHDGRHVDFTGKIVAAEPPRLLTYQLTVAWNDELGRDPNRLTFKMEPYGAVVRLMMTNEATARLLSLVGTTWPAMICSLKSLVETGKPLPLDVVFGPQAGTKTR